MYYKDSPYGQTSYPQASYGGTQHAYNNTHAPLEYSSNGITMTMDTLKQYFTNNWMMLIGVAIIIVIIIAWLMSGKNGKYHNYNY